MWKQIKGVAAVLLPTVGLIPELFEQILTCDRKFPPGT